MKKKQILLSNIYKTHIMKIEKTYRIKTGKETLNAIAFFFFFIFLRKKQRIWAIDIACQFYDCTNENSR